MKTNNSYLKHAFNVVKNPAGYTPEAVEKACIYIQKKWAEMEANNDSLCFQLSEMMHKIQVLENEKNDMTKTIADLQKQLSENKNNAKERKAQVEAEKEATGQTKKQKANTLQKARKKVAGK